MKKKCAKSISILFIGNSFSYYHALPNLIVHLAGKSDSNDIFVDGVFKGGATLKQIWDAGIAIKKIRSRRWDYVVLQERGRLGGIIENGIVHVGKPEEFYTSVIRFNKEIKNIGAKTILYCPPSFIGTGFLKDAKKLNTIYMKLAKKLNTKLLSSGPAFILAMKERPEIDLFESDKHHPNPLGTYLIAALFCRKLFQRKISDIPAESFSSKSQRIPKNPKRIKLSGANAKFIWSVANRVK